MDLVFKEAEMEDITEIREIILQAENFGEPFLDHELSLLKRYLENDFGGAFIAVHKYYRTVGYLAYEIRFRSVHIMTMITHHNHLEKGIGQFLIQELASFLEEHHPKVSVLRVDTGDFMDYAQKFYLSCGFQVCGYVSHDFSWYNHQVHFAMRLNDNKK